MRRGHAVRGFLLLAALGTLGHAPEAPARTIALVGGTVHPVSVEPIPGATVVIEDGRIAGAGVDYPIPAGAERVDVSGLHVYPGMIGASTDLGLMEIESVRGTRDVNETGTVNPNARAVIAVNADSEVIPTTRSSGVLTVLSATAGGILSGTSVIWNLDGWNWEDMALVREAALHVRWPSMHITSSYYGPKKSKEEQEKERAKQLDALRDTFANARAYLRARDAMTRGGARHDTDVRYEAMLPALRREMPVFFHADDLLQIESALDFAVEESLRAVVVGGGDAWRIADRLIAESVPVILDDPLELPRRSWEPYDVRFAAAAKLHEAGVTFCINQGSYTQIRNLPYIAAMSVPYGLPRDEALRAVTLYPARILGLEDRLGTIEPGKDANLIVTDGDPLEISTHVRRAFIAGREVDLGSRHTRLYDRYRSRPRPDGAESKLDPAY